MTDFCLFQSHLLSQNGNNTVLLILFVIMTGFFPLDNLIYLSGLMKESEINRFESLNCMFLRMKIRIVDAYVVQFSPQS
jgi:hypothetical protein